MVQSSSVIATDGIPIEYNGKSRKFPASRGNQEMVSRPRHWCLFFFFFLVQVSHVQKEKRGMIITTVVMPGEMSPYSKKPKTHAT